MEKIPHELSEIPDFEPDPQPGLLDDTASYSQVEFVAAQKPEQSLGWLANVVRHDHIAVNQTEIETSLLTEPRERFGLSTLRKITSALRRQPETSLKLPPYVKVSNRPYRNDSTEVIEPPEALIGSNAPIPPHKPLLPSDLSRPERAARRPIDHVDRFRLSHEEHMTNGVELLKQAWDTKNQYGPEAAGNEFRIASAHLLEAIASDLYEYKPLLWAAYGVALAGQIKAEAVDEYIGEQYESSTFNRTDDLRRIAKESIKRGLTDAKVIHINQATLVKAAKLAYEELEAIGATKEAKQVLDETRTELRAEENVNFEGLQELQQFETADHQTQEEEASEALDVVLNEVLALAV